MPRGNFFDLPPHCDICRMLCIKLGRICPNSFEFWFFEFHILKLNVEFGQIWILWSNLTTNLAKFNHLGPAYSYFDANFRSFWCWVLTNLHIINHIKPKSMVEFGRIRILRPNSTSNLKFNLDILHRIPNYFKSSSKFVRAYYVSPTHVSWHNKVSQEYYDHANLQETLMHCNIYILTKLALKLEFFLPLQKKLSSKTKNVTWHFCLILAPLCDDTVL